MDFQEKTTEYLGLSFYQKLKLFPYLKGLLKPFKGKGDYEHFGQQLLETRNALNQSVREIERRLRRPPWTLMLARMVAHPTGVGPVNLRWRTQDIKAMGVHLWDSIMQDPKTPDALVDELYDMELMRIQVNMQIAACHYLRRASEQCMEKVAHAEAVRAQRLGQKALATNARKEQADNS